MKQPIDLVIPYVNYTDKEWQQSFIATCEQNNITPAPESNQLMRNWWQQEREDLRNV